MKFLATGWLWLLLAIPVIYVLVLGDEKRRQAQFERFAARPLWRTLVPEMDPGARLRKAAVWLAAVAFAIVALARPQWGSHEETAKATGLDIMVALDVSNSMETEDVIPSRLKKARHLVKSLVEQLRGDRVGLVAFAASSYVACPLTTDTDYVLETLQILGPRMIASQGTDIGIGLDTARKALDRGAEEITSPGAGGGAPDPTTQAPQPSHVIILISDGEDHEEGAIAAARSLKENNAKLYILGIGTEKGGPVAMRDESGGLIGYKKNRRGEPVVSTFRPDELMKVAQAAGGRYWNVTAGEQEIQDLLQDMGALSRTEYAERRYLVFEERFQYPLAVAVLLIFLQISLPVRRMRKLVAPKSAKSVPAIVLIGLGLGGLSASAQAQSLLDRQTPIEAYLDNEKGLKAFKDGKIEEAEKKFGTAQALDPNLPELQYNQGVLQMQKGEPDAAIRDFGDAAKGAMERNDSKLEGKALYNLGSALSKKGDIQGAVRSYLGAIQSAQGSKDAQLEGDARRNLQLLIHERQKQKQQEKDEKEKKDQDKKDGKGEPNPKDQQDKEGKEGKEGKDKKDGKSPKDQKDPKDKSNQDGKDQDNKAGDKSEQAKGQPKKYEDNAKGRGRQFNSPKLSKDDAERVMAELSNKEKDLQAKLKKQHGNPQLQNNDKDW